LVLLPILERRRQGGVSLRRFQIHLRRGVLGAVLALSTLLAVAACRPGLRQSSISREEYVDLYVEILLAADEAPDSAAASDSARAILERHGLSEDVLFEFAQSYADDPDYLASAWQEIENRLRNPEPADSTEEQ
jgi:hypothetical protein